MWDISINPTILIDRGMSKPEHIRRVILDIFAILCIDMKWRFSVVLLPLARICGVIHSMVSIVKLFIIHGTHTRISIVNQLYEYQYIWVNSLEYMYGWQEINPVSKKHYIEPHPFSRAKTHIAISHTRLTNQATIVIPPHAGSIENLLFGAGLFIIIAFRDCTNIYTARYSAAFEIDEQHRDRMFVCHLEAT